ncbi:MAG: hypothetical protein ACHQ2Z_13150 [Elusimicrobiota bacterium]
MFETRRLKPLLLCVMAALPGSRAIGAVEKIELSGPKSDLAFETSPFMRATAYSHPETLSNDAAASGAYGPYNRDFDAGKNGEWFIESQRFGFDAVGAGLAHGRKDLIDRGLHIFDWGLAHQSPDGSFHCPDRYHSTAFFLEAVARAALLLESSPFRDDYKAWVESAKPKLRAGALWMISPAQEKKGLTGDSPYTHRYYLNADAVGFVGLLDDDADLIRKSKDYVRMGLSKQAPQGFNPEKGGSDTSYHAVGLVFALRYYDILADKALREEMSPMISSGLKWLGSRVREDGSFDQTGNTRTGSGQEIGRDKKPKTMSYGSAARAFADWSRVTGDSAGEEIARRVFLFARSSARVSASTRSTR